jgi:hypothetical protein
MLIPSRTLDWLLHGDPAVRWQTLRDLTDSDEETIQLEQEKIAGTGWGKRLLSFQDKSGTWGGGLYSPKWISTTYTLLLLRRMGLMPGLPPVLKACGLLLDKGLYHDGGINLFPSLMHSETCVTGMILSIVSFFQYRDDRTHRLADFLLGQQMNDGGWNCLSFSGAVHGSFHTTINVLEGLWEFEKENVYQKDRILESRQRGHEFLLVHSLYRSHRTGKVVDPRMTRFTFPPRWHYDILRALDYFQECRSPYDARMEDALELVRNKQTKEGRWPSQNRHPGRTYFEMEQAGNPSRWNTLRALRILRRFERK